MVLDAADHYAVLGTTRVDYVSAGRKAYKKMAQKIHPGVGRRVAPRNIRWGIWTPAVLVAWDTQLCRAA